MPAEELIPVIKTKKTIKILLISVVIAAMGFVSAASAYPLQDDIENLYDMREGAFLEFTYYEPSFYEAMKNKNPEQWTADSLREKVNLLDPVNFYPEAWIHNLITKGIVEPLGAPEAETDSESEEAWENEPILLREGPAEGYPILTALEQDPEKPQKYRVVDEINNYLLIETELLEGWVKKSEVQRRGLMEALSLDIVKITGPQINFRSGPSSQDPIIDQVYEGERYSLLEIQEDWVKIRKNDQTGWVHQAYTEEVIEWIPEEMYQFLQLNPGVPSGITEEEIQQIFLQLPGELKHIEEIGRAFIKAGEITELNEVYLAALAMNNYRAETARFYEGLEVDQVAGSPVELKRVYNFFSIGAVPRDPERSAAETAYEKGWFTPEKAIVEGAQWILKNQIQGNLNTLHKMAVGSYLDLIDDSLGESEDLLSTQGLPPEVIQSIEGDLQEHREIRGRIKDIYDEFDLKNQRFTIPVFETEWYWPVPGFQRLSSDFGYREDPFEGDIRFHIGIDIPAPAGTPVVAVQSGVVTKNYKGESYGNWIEIDHGEGITTRYAHNAENLATMGSVVEKGDLIARIGSTGRSTGPHLHFEIRQNNRAVDPLPYFLENH